MRTIYKYKLQMGRTYLRMPLHSQMLTVQMQDGQPCLWAMVLTERPFQEILIDIYGTGATMPDQPGFYIATFQDGPYVWHAFEATP